LPSSPPSSPSSSSPHTPHQVADALIRLSDGKLLRPFVAALFRLGMQVMASAPASPPHSWTEFLVNSCPGAADRPAWLPPVDQRSRASSAGHRR
jgi:hypothetical protein